MTKDEYLLSVFGGEPYPDVPEEDALMEHSEAKLRWRNRARVASEAWDAAMEERMSGNHLTRGVSFYALGDALLNNEAAIKALRAQVLELQAALKEVLPIVRPNIDINEWEPWDNMQKLANELVRG
jgi:hypothetical protein